jgi:hypothetical protein
MLTDAARFLSKFAECPSLSGSNVAFGAGKLHAGRTAVGRSATDAQAETGQSAWKKVDYRQGSHVDPMLTAATVSYGEDKLCDRLRFRSYHQFNIAWTPGLAEPRFQGSKQSQADVVAVAGHESAPSSFLAQLAPWVQTR